VKGALRWCAVFAALELGCAGGRDVAVQWVYPDLIHPSPASFPDAPAVTLYRSDQVMLLLSTQPGGNYAEETQHEVIEVRTEAGKNAADVRVIVQGKPERLTLHARRVDPDGSVTEVPQEQILEQTGTHQGDTLLTARVFRIPGVKVGSVLESVVTVVSRAIPSYRATVVSEARPIARYEADLSCQRGVDYGLKTYHLDDASAPDEKDVGRLHHIRFKAINVPAQVDEPAAPPAKFDQPWWAFSIRAVMLGTKRVEISGTWPAAMKLWADRVYEPRTLSERLGLEVPEGPCKTPACRVKAAWDLVREHTDYRGAGSMEAARSWPKVLEGRSATGFERALLLRELLEKAGLQAQAAGAVDAWSGTYDEEVPTSVYWNHLLVWLPPQPGIDGGMWLDPSCEYCAAGELPDPVRGARAIAFSRRPNLTDNGEAAVHSTSGEPAPEDRIATAYDVTLDATGKAEVSVNRVLRGPAAAGLRKAAESSDDTPLKKRAEDFVSSRAPTGALSTSATAPCSKSDPECKESLSFSVPGYATLDGKQLLVPLTVLDPAPSKRFVATGRQRAVVSSRHLTEEEIVHLHFPAGYRLTHAPDGLEQSAHGYSQVLSIDPEPGGLRIRRSLVQPLGGVVAAEYPRIRGVVNGYAEARQAVITLERK
jgi:hypothetical protein